MHCTQVLGQQVAVAVGLERDPLGKKVLGLLVSVSLASASGISGVIGILEGIATSFLFLSDEVIIGSSAVSAEDCEEIRKFYKPSCTIGSSAAVSISFITAAKN